MKTDLRKDTATVAEYLKAKDKFETLDLFRLMDVLNELIYTDIKLKPIGCVAKNYYEENEDFLESCVDLRNILNDLLTLIDPNSTDEEIRLVYYGLGLKQHIEDLDQDAYINR